MKTINTTPRLRHSAMALAILAAFGGSCAAEDLSQYTKPSSTVSFGVGSASGDSMERAIFGQYNGWRSHRSGVLLDLEYITRDDATGTWTFGTISDLGQSNRELAASREKQGDYKYALSYSELERVAPRTVNTGMTGVGSTTPTIARLATAGSGADVDLKLTRKAAGLGYEKWLSKSLQFELSFKNEDKEGARMWGRGYDCAAYVCGSSTTTAINQATLVKNAILMLAEPVDSTTRQLDARLNFHTDALLLSAGYYGTVFINHLTSLRPTVPNVFNSGIATPLPGYAAVTSKIIAGGGMSLQDALQTPMALPPDSQSHQFYLDGSYALAPKTRLNFKLSYSNASQHDNFAANGLGDAPAGVADLGAKVTTKLAQLGVTARPFDKLSLSANLRHEAKDDSTPEARYNVEPNAVVPATSPASYTNVYWYNGLTSSTRSGAKFEASYRLPADTRLTYGIDFNKLEREVPTSIIEDKVAGISTLRAENSDLTRRIELRRSVSESLTGSLGFSRSKRYGSDWTTLSQLNPATPGISAANLQLINTYCGGKACYGQQIPAWSIISLSANTPFPVSMTDLERDKWKLAMDWNPDEKFSFQLVAEAGKDKNLNVINAVAGGKGWRDSDVELWSVDAAYALSEAWKLSAYGSASNQTQRINHSTGYMADINTINHAGGLTLSGKLSSQLQVGGTLSYLRDVNHYNIAAASGTAGTLPGPLTVVAPSAANLAQAAIGMPDVTYRNVGLKLYAAYAVSKQGALQMDLAHQRLRFDEWSWGYNGTPFVFADNTTLVMRPEQRVNVVAVRYVYKF